MAISRFGRQVKRAYQTYGFRLKLTAVVILGLCFVVIWSVFSPSSYSITTQREIFAEPISGNRKKAATGFADEKREEKRVEKLDSGLKELKLNDGGKNGSDGEAKAGISEVPREIGGEKDTESSQRSEAIPKEGEEEEEEDEEETGESGNVEVELDGETTKEEEEEDVEDTARDRRRNNKLGALFDPKAHYSWELCKTRSKHNYIPCIDMVENGGGKARNHRRHRERSCHRAAAHQMCLVPLPLDGYETPIRWPESMSKIIYKNVAHEKLVELVKTQSWVMQSGEHLIFPQNHSALDGQAQHYLVSIQEMVPDIEWGKNIRLVLEIGCKDSSFVASLAGKGVLVLTLGLTNDLFDLAQVALERGFPAYVSPFETRRLPFPSGVFDTIHCGDCQMPWHSNGGKLLLEVNRILRPGGYFILSTKHSSVEAEEALSTLTASICWNILADKADDVSDVGIKVYQKPESNDIYKLRRKKFPPLCNANDNPDAAWNAPIKLCLHQIPSAIEERGTEWPEEWPKRLETFPEWMNNHREKIVAEDKHWGNVIDKSYLAGFGIDWSNIRNVMDMKAIHGGFAAALGQRKDVWVMNVVLPVHNAQDTLPIILERGLLGIYHDWCESFGTYPRSYDLLHADHLFSRLKNRCKQPVSIVVEMDRMLRPGGWAIVRDKVEILDSVEGILKSLHWEIRMTFAQNKEGILCARKTSWRP